MKMFKIKVRYYSPIRRSGGVYRTKQRAMNLDAAKQAAKIEFEENYPAMDYKSASLDKD